MIMCTNELSMDVLARALSAVLSTNDKEVKVIFTKRSVENESKNTESVQCA